ncbi:MAG: hypothetical protein WKF58_16005 [Ilumatobacteraceae bacterium]
MRLLVLGTYRHSELFRSHPLLDTLAEMHRHRGVGRVGLVGLDETGVASLMEAAAGHTLDDALLRFARELHRETDGNPFFVSEVLRHLAETGVIYQDASGHWVATAAVEPVALPSSVQTVIGARAGRLGGVAERVLSLAAVIGRDFDVDVLAGAAAISDDDLLGILGAAAAAALVRELTDTPGHYTPGHYTFAHALIQHTLYDTLGPTRQARAHRPGGRGPRTSRERRPAVPSANWPATGRAPPNSTVSSRPSATRVRRPATALGALAPGDAVRYYTQALDLSARTSNTDPVLAVDVRIGLGIAQRHTGDPAFRRPSSARSATGRRTSVTPTGSPPPPWPTTAACSPPPA